AHHGEGGADASNRAELQDGAEPDNQDSNNNPNDSDEGEDLLFPGFAPKTFYVLDQKNYFRLWCLRCITWPWFERISMCVIIMNCVTLGMYQPCSDEVCTTVRCQMLESFDHFIFAFFAIEMLIKMVAMGVWGKDTYLAEAWNRLDCFIVVAGSIEYAVDTENLSISAIRTIRVLRPLRAINRIPSMRILVMLLLDTLPMLGNVLLLCFFVFFIFGIIGVQLWSGVLRHRCFLNLNESYTLPDYVPVYYTPNRGKTEYICSSENNSGIRTCDASTFPLFEYEGIKCNGSARMDNDNGPTNDSCVNWNQYYTRCEARAENPFMGAVSFDNIGLAWVAIFQVISLESWVNIMYYVQDAHSFWDFTYFVALIVIGSFFMINLCLVVIATQFSETKKRETERMMQERKRFQSCSTLASNSEPGGCYTELLKLVAQVYRRVKRKAIKMYYKTRGLQKINPEKSLSLRRKKAKRKGSRARSSSVFTAAGCNAGPTGQGSSLKSSLQQQQQQQQPQQHHSSSSASASSRHQSFSFPKTYTESVSKCLSNAPPLPEVLSRLQKRLRRLVESTIFQRSILLAILLNTLSMAVEHHNQPELLTLILEYSNIVFCVLFGAEMAFKILSYGVFGYISNGFNVFDSFIVILSIVELAQGGASGLSVLRTFRLLRILKLVRFMPALRRQLVVMLRTMDNVATFFALLVLFMFIFSILGMSLFGCKFCHKLEDGKQKCDRKNFDSLLWAIITVFQVPSLAPLPLPRPLILGMNLFGGSFCESPDGSTCSCNDRRNVSLGCVCDRANFDNLIWSLVTVFQVLTQEDWNTVLYNGMHRTSHWASLYFIALMTFGNYVLFNLLVAILVEGFSTEVRLGLVGEDDEEEQEKRRLAENNNIDDLQLPKSPINSIDLDQPEVSSTHLSPNVHHEAGPRNPPIITHTAATPMATPQGSPHENAIKDTNNHKMSLAVKRSALKSTLSVDSDKSVGINVYLSYYELTDCNGHPPLNNQRTLSPQNSLKGRALTPRNSFKSYHSWSRNNSVGSGRSICNSFELSRQNSFTSHRTLNSLGSCNSKEDNRVRKFCHHLISRRWFDNAVLFFIALNCITLAMERPDIPPDSAEREFLTHSNYIFTIVFTIEMFVKVVAKGLVVGKHAYLKSGWNVMDGFLVIISLIDIFISLSAASSPKIFGILRVFRLLRTLRPLRVISRAPGLKLVVQTLLSSLRPIGNIVLICCTFFIIFGILGVQLFKGTFYYCKGPEVDHIKNRTMCEAVKGNEWINQKYNFDNLGMALMALFVLASKDGWVQIMYTGLDAVGVDQQPIENYNEWRLIYFISFLLLVAFFVLNMFVGVVVENFHKCRESQEIEERAKRAAKRQEKLDKKRKSEEKSKTAAAQEMREPPYWANYSTSRLLIHTVINSKYFDLAIAAVIGLNVITMAMEYYQMPEELKFALKIFNFFFTSVFILEAAMKIVALGFYRYIKDRWNQLDIMIVILSIVGIILEEMRTNVIPINPTIIRVMRVLRIARVLKLLKMAKGIRALLDTVIQALPQVGNLGLLFFLLFFIFAALGVELFGRLECSNENPCEGLGVHAHFQHFGLAFLTLFRVATGDNWNGIMKDTLRDKCNRADDCLTNCCVSPIIAPVYFVVFVLMAQFVLVNVVVAVLMKHLEETYKYKELDDELEEELQAEMCALALAGKAAPEGIEIKESHKMMDEDAILLEEALAAENAANKHDAEAPDNGPDGEKLGGPQMSTLPSFSFSVRPPSEEQTHSEDTGVLSPVNASLTIECMASSWSSMDSTRLGVSPGSMTATSGSSPCSERSVRISSPPIRRAPSPYLLS
ncbi:hypothetical protein EGW08_003019, partial [Elysia chlorotica]